MQLSLPSGRVLERVRHQVSHRARAAVLGLSTSVWHRFLYPGENRPPPAQMAALRSWFGALIAEDFANAEAGFYSLAATHDSTIGLLRILPEAVRDMPQMVRRARQKSFGVETAGDQYPAYYRRAFHWQVDGWLSAHSARVYDLQVEFLFFGTMDMMRRMVLPSLARELRGLANARVLDVACGTGRLVHHLRETIPRAQVFGLDLSPHYLQKAQQTCADMPGVSFLCGNAEEIPLADGSLDAAVCGFLFHELPGDARRRVVAEVHRVLKPGGLFVFQDAPQQGDRNGEELRFYLDWFPSAYHEPFFKGYQADPIEPLLSERRFAVLASEPKLLSKVVIARKAAPYL